MDEDALIDRILNTLMQLIDDGVQIPDEVIQAVTEILGEKIRELSQRAPSTPVQPIIQGQEEPAVNHGETPYPSSNINAFRYDPKTGKLIVKFMGKDVANAGPTYSYEGVPSYIFDILRRGAVGPKTSGANRWHRWKEGVTPSHGAAMAALIKAGGFPYKKIS